MIRFFLGILIKLETLTTKHRPLADTEAIPFTTNQQPQTPL